MRHGRSQYRQGCRCDICAEDNREYMRRYREGKRADVAVYEAPPPGPWVTDGACRGTPWPLWFPEKGTSNVDGQRGVCASCPVQGECLAYALEHPYIVGIWGGTTGDERRRGCPWCGTTRTAGHLCSDCRTWADAEERRWTRRGYKGEAMAA